MTLKELVDVVRLYGVTQALVNTSRSPASITLFCGGGVSVSVSPDDVRHLNREYLLPVDVLATLDPYLGPDRRSGSSRRPSAPDPR